MTIDQVVKYVKDFPNTFNSNVLRSLIYQGIATNWEPDPDPSSVGFYVAKSMYNPETKKTDFTECEKLPLNYTVEHDLYEYASGSFQSGIYPAYEDEDLNYLDYGLIRSDDNIIVTARTSSGYDLQVSTKPAKFPGHPNYLYNGLTYDGELPQDFYDKAKGSYQYTTITMKAGLATLIFNMGSSGEQ